MQMPTFKPCTGCARRRRALATIPRKLGDITDIFGKAISAFASGAGSGLTSGGTSGGSAPGTMVTTTVSPQIAVNPQISPIFVQQMQPQNSPVSSGTSQYTPTAQLNPSAGATGSGYPSSLPLDLTGGSGYSTPQVPAIPAAPTDYTKLLTYGGFGLIALFAIKSFSGSGKGKRAMPYHRRLSHKAHGGL